LNIEKYVLISGAGPSGIAAAIKLHQLGWNKSYLSSAWSRPWS